MGRIVNLKFVVFNFVRTRHRKNSETFYFISWDYSSFPLTSFGKFITHLFWWRVNKKCLGTYCLDIFSVHKLFGNVMNLIYKFYL